MEKEKIIISKGTIKGKFTGFKNSSTVFEFTDGQKWRQSEAKFVHHFAVNPEVEIIQKEGKYYMEVRGIEQAIEVRRIK